MRRMIMLSQASQRTYSSNPEAGISHSDHNFGPAHALDSFKLVEICALLSTTAMLTAGFDRGSCMRVRHALQRMEHLWDRAYRHIITHTRTHTLTQSGAVLTETRLKFLGQIATSLTSLKPSASRQAGYCVCARAQVSEVNGRVACELSRTINHHINLLLCMWASIQIAGSRSRSARVSKGR